jgi:broad specificity phosphatase PhoE
MTIHLLRHFKVQDNTPSWLNSDEFNQWVDTYDILPIKVIEVKLPKNIDLILCSTLLRAKKTVKELPKIEIIYTDKLVEVGSRVFFNTNIKLQKYIWFTMGTLFWYLNSLDGENRVDTIKRAKEVVEELKALKQENILIVSHGFFMKVLAKELKEEGFLGEIEFRPKNGKIYSFCRV